jgi:hypothetical protein
MYVTYFDEVKADPKQGQNSYYFAGICVLMSEIRDIEAKLNTLAQEVFSSNELSKSTEFHSCAIYYRKDAFKRMKAEQRCMIFERLATILAESVNVKRVYAEIRTDRLEVTQKKPNEIAFAFFCEKVQQIMGGLKQPTILIGDQDNDQMVAMIKDFARYRANGTFWQYGVDITEIVDTVHFAQSHHCRMIQLADFYAFYISSRTSRRKKDWFNKMYWKSVTNKFFPLADAYNAWPPNSL